MPIILGAFVVFLVFICARLFLNAKPETLMLLLKSVLGAVAIVVVVVLMLSGRFINVIVGLAALMALLPSLRNFFKNQIGKKRPTIADPLSSMTVPQACDILEVSSDATAQEIKASHHRLIQKIHPDQGGSDYLAAQVNQAKEVLMAHRKNK
ncbi:MAG: DnaJ domain-containing protein [Janthinobacterium lividum]